MSFSGVGWVRSVRGTGLSLLALTAGLLGLWAVALASSASAALPSNCSQSGQTVTCTFSYTGSEQTWAVPAGVASVQIDAVAAPEASTTPTMGSVATAERSRPTLL